jgi:class 3 adenylate cyclase/predicted ATPase
VPVQGLDIAAWLRDLGLERYAPAFGDAEVTPEALPELTDTDLRGLGLPLGPRKLVLKAIRDLAGPCSSPPSAGAERRQLTVMFGDLVGSTALSSRLDPEDLREVIAAYHACAAEVVQRHEGFLAKFLGDGVLAYFGWPQAHEEDAERAIRSGLALVEAVGRLAPGSQRLQARVGVATGLVVVGDLVGSGEAQERGVVGETPNLAARLQAAAEPGTVVIAETTRRLTGRLFDYHDLGAAPVKGFAAPVRAWRVLGESAVASRFEALRPGRTLLVGREEELALLLRRWRQARSGEGRVVLLAGEPGIGKSRLAAELLEAEPHACARYFCSPHHVHSPLAPAVGQLERAAGFERGDTAERKREKLEALMAPASLRREERALLAELLSLPARVARAVAEISPQQRKERTLTALVRQLEALARRQPVLALWEDAHWVDPTSRELLDLLVARVPDLPVLLVVTARPEFRPAWSGQAHVTSLALSRLGRRENEALVRRVTGGKTLPPELVDQIVARGDGVPLFVEELTKAVLESGLVREEGGGYTVVGPLSPLAVPSSLQASLTARLDRLAPLRDVAQVGAAIGREFSYDLLAAVAGRPEGQLRDAMAQLASAGLVLARGQPPEAVYTFKHALVQEAAYATLLRARRAEIHGRIASALRSHHPDLVRGQPETLARHLTEAGLAADAVDHWLKAGQLAAARSANVEAASHLHNGLDLLPRLPGGTERDRAELELQATLGPALNAVKGYAAPETLAAFERARELIEQTEDDSRQDAVLTGLFVAYFNRGEFRKAHEVGVQFLDVAERQDETAPKCIGHRMVAASFNAMGDFRPALPHAEAAVVLYDPELHGPLAWRYVHDLGVAALNHLGIALWHAGRADHSLAREREALELADQLQHVNTTCYALFYCGALSAVRRRDFAELRRFAARLQAYVREHKMPHWAPFAVCLVGAALPAAGQAEEGIDLCQDGIKVCEATGTKAFLPAFLAGLAEAQLAAGRPEQAERTILTALRMSRRTAERWMDAELWRLAGQASVLSGRHAPGRAERLFRRAAGCAEVQGSRPLHLRAVTSLARLWRDQGRAEAARDLLAPVYARFGEDAGTPDCQEAKLLLEAL